MEGLRKSGEKRVRRRPTSVAQILPRKGLRPFAKIKSEVKLVVFEGPDGVGKTTLARRLLRTLRNEQIPSILASFPGRQSGTLGAHINRLYHRPLRYGVQSARVSALQTVVTAAHIDVIESEVLPALRSGQLVILDRYWWSTWVYGQHAGLSLAYVTRLIELEQLSWDGVVPAFVFLISRSTSSSLRPTVHRQLASWYRTLAREERHSGQYPIRVITNDGAVRDTLDVVASLLQDVM